MKRLRPALLALLFSAAPLRAQTDEADSLPPPPPPSRARVAPPSAQPLVTESARVGVKPAEPDLLRLLLHGEYQIRLAALSPLRLRRSDGSFDMLEQEERLYHWLRITPRLQIGDRFELVAQADVPRGMFAGAEPNGVSTHDELYAEQQPFQFDPRWLFAEYHAGAVALRVGQQPFHHAMGLVENDGNHPSLFGDYEGGDRFERVQLLLRPSGSRLVLIAAADLVYKDETADLGSGDIALRGTLGARFGDRGGHVSVLGIVRHQRYDGSDSEEREFNTVLIDSAGGFETEIRGAGAMLFGEYEVAFRFGDESLGRTLTGPVDDDDLTVTGFGGATRLGVVWPSAGRNAWGRFVFSTEVGHASGDSAPQDRDEQAFAFDPNHKVGLLLFDHVLRWKSARSKAIVGDSPRVSDLATRGSVTGATYLNPTFVFRPVRQLDLKAGMVLAQSSEDLVDPANVLLTGAATNYDGGPPARDLGIELDVGTEWRLELNTDLNLELGAQGGVLFPGRAFDSASGNALDTQYIGVARLGVQY